MRKIKHLPTLSEKISSLRVALVRYHAIPMDFQMEMIALEKLARQLESKIPKK